MLDTTTFGGLSLHNKKFISKSSVHDFYQKINENPFVMAENKTKKQHSVQSLLKSSVFLTDLKNGNSFLA